MMIEGQSKYYYDFIQMKPLVSIKPKIIANLEEKKSTVLIIEWIEYVSYFKKLCKCMEFYIVKCLVIDYYSRELPSSRFLLKKIMENLNLYIYDMIHIEYFTSFENSVNRFNKLKLLIFNNQELFNDNKKKEFVHYLISSLDLFQQIVNVCEENYIFQPDSLSLKFFYNIDIYNNEFIPFTGGKINDTIVKSFWITRSCVTNYQYLHFMENNGYLEKSYWSKEGYIWVTQNNIFKPSNWIFSNDKWYVSNIPIEDIYNYPVEKISYYEAEACSKFYGGRLPTENEWMWVSTNRNKTSHPNGIDSPYFFESALNLSFIEPANEEKYESLMKIYHMYGNVWEYTSTLSVDDQIINVCLKGGDFKIPSFLLSKDLKMNIERDEQRYSTGFRVVK